MNKYAKQIDKALQTYESYHPFHERNIDWICNRIDWCWKWRKISEKEKDEFVDRICEIMDNTI